MPAAALAPPPRVVGNRPLVAAFGRAVDDRVQPQAAAAAAFAWFGRIAASALVRSRCLALTGNYPLVAVFGRTGGRGARRRSTAAR